MERDLALSYMIHTIATSVSMPPQMIDESPSYVLVHRWPPLTIVGSSMNNYCRKRAPASPPSNPAGTLLSQQPDSLWTMVGERPPLSNRCRTTTIRPLLDP